MSVPRPQRFSRQSLWLASLATVVVSLTLQLISLRQQTTATVVWYTTQTPGSDLFSEMDLGFGRLTLILLKNEPHNTAWGTPNRKPRSTGVQVNSLPLALPAQHFPLVHIERSGVSVSLWAPAVLAAIGCVVYNPRFLRKGPVCLCGHELTGNTSVKCPKCGTPIHSRR